LDPERKKYRGLQHLQLTFGITLKNTNGGRRLIIDHNELKQSLFVLGITLLTSTSGFC